MRRREITQGLIGTMAATNFAVAEPPPPGVSVTNFAVTPSERAAAISIPHPEHSPGDVRRYGAVANSAGHEAVDNTDIVQRVFNMTRASGGVIFFPAGDWSLHLDISTVPAIEVKPVIVEGNGSTLRCSTAARTNSSVLYGNNSRGKNEFSGSNVQFRNCNFSGRRFQSTSRGDVDFAVNFDGTSAVFYDCSFQYAVVAGFYAIYGQYTEFWSCLFGSCAATSVSTGCLLDSRSAAASTNEVLFSRCKFFSCSNFLVLKGCFSTRIRDTTFQGATLGGSGGIVLDQDSSGQGTVGTIIDGCWFEINQVPHIHGRICSSTRIHNNSFFASGGINRVTFEYCYDLEVSDNNSYTPLDCRLSHVSSDTLTASLKWHGNNFVPKIDVQHSGPSYVDVQCAAVRTKRNDNILLTTGQTGLGGLPLVQMDQSGFRTEIERNTVTPLFKVNLESFNAVPYAPVLVLEVQLFAWLDTAQPLGYAASARAQRFYAFITNNSNRLSSYISPAIDGVELGHDLDSHSLGSLSITADASGSLATENAAVEFACSFAGSGGNAPQANTASVGYRVTAMGGNTFSVTRL